MAQGTDIYHQNERKKSWVTILLFLSCVTTVLLLWKVEPVTPQKLTSQAQLDSLITFTFAELELPPSQIRQRYVQIDSVFSRTIYTVKVAPEFSKTTLHYYLQQQVWPYQVQIVARLQFPEQDMTIHFLLNDTIQRTIYVESDPGIEYIQRTFFTPPDQ